MTPLTHRGPLKKIPGGNFGKTFLEGIAGFYLIARSAKLSVGIWQVSF